MQELMDEFAKKADSLPDTLDANVAYLVFQECYDIAKLMLQKEKEVMCEFTYKCRNLMAADEFAITHWYDKTFGNV